MGIRKNRARRRAANSLLEAGEGYTITPTDMHTIKLALQSRVRDMHRDGKHEAAEAAMVTLNRIQHIIETAR